MASYGSDSETANEPDFQRALDRTGSGGEAGGQPQNRRENRREWGGGQISMLQVSTAVFGGCTKVRIAEH